MATLDIRDATRADLPLILAFIRGLAAYERLADECVADIPMLERFLFGERPAAEVLLADLDGEPAGFALYFTSFSTFLGRPGIYLEDLFVRPEARGAGVGRALLARLARITLEREYGRLEWAVLDWNADAIGFYQRQGARPMHEWTTYRLAGEALHGLAAASGAA